ncbi:Protein N-acetyltransferase, RimJ/RimL family [Klenkia soli]|uniref:Protein N-acetyltransferase, RimJ/RimL family n=1 Tax=Klenkia soli TaxID=1052260 RepID=A0A1H0CIK9_9ACTN|nr:GNAT family N-acetyltransferase [Klenkia soli]SDN57727.1 Protein N-acetyltransferase, RimJ/RimL family [Klenkia soli]
MLHDVHVAGPAFGLRPVVPGDAAAIVALRRDPRRSGFIHETSPDVADQERWLDAYSRRPGDLYWAVHRLSDGAVEGFVGLYDIADGEAEWGRWVLQPRSLAGAETVWLVHEAGFGVLGLGALVTRTLAANESVVALHERYGATRTRVLPAHATIAGETHDAVEMRVTAEDWARIGPPLLASSQRAARLVGRTRS